LKKLYQDGSLSAVSAGEEVVPASELADALRQIRELQRLLGKKTVEVEILKEAVEYGRAKKWIERWRRKFGQGDEWDYWNLSLA
jgi:transposase